MATALAVLIAAAALDLAATYGSVVKSASEAVITIESVAVKAVDPNPYSGKMETFMIGRATSVESYLHASTIPGMLLSP